MDTERDEYNGGGTAYMFPNATEGEQTAYERMDFLSNGFKLRTNGGEWNGSGRHILYLAFAENSIRNINRSADNGKITRRSIRQSTLGEILCGH
jgi:hypothetical protein